MLSQLTKISNRSRIEIILHVVLKIQFIRACFQRGEASANFGVCNNIVFIVFELIYHVRYCTFTLSLHLFHKKTTDSF